MLRTVIGLLLTGFTISIAATASSADTIATLVHNPFNKPEFLATPPKVERKKQPLTADVLPRLRAVLISDTLPLVIVDDEVLGLGDDINGYRLLSVDEGRAVFEKLGNKYTLLLNDEDPEKP